jgi:DNA repair exonuclease SbcCD ATPase subunit
MNINLKNFLSTGNSFTTINLNSNKTTLIIGRNGSGKSTILDALAFSLFGKAFRNINKGNLVNSVNNKDCVVEIQFKTNNKEYRVVRGIKPNIFEIYCDGILLNQSSATKDYQDYLETNVLKMSFKSFIQIVILGSASFTPFMQLSPADRRLVIEDLLDIQIFTVMNNIVKSKIQKIKENLVATSIELTNKTQNKDFIERAIDSLKESDKENLTGLENKKKTYLDNIASVESNILKLEEKRNTLHKKISSLNDLKSKHKKLLVYKAKIETNRDQTEDKIHFLCNEESCPTCKQQIQEEFRKKELETYKSKKKEYDNGIVSISDQIAQIEKEISSMEAISREIDQLNSDLSSHTTKLASFHSIINGINEEMKKVGQSNKLLASSIEDLYKITGEIEKLEKEKDSLLNEQILADTAQLLLKDGGIKTKIIKQYVPIINKSINKFLTQMDFFVNFNIDENFNESIKSRFRDEFSYHSFSEGEKFRIDLALLLTWRHIARMRNSVNCNLLLLDEIFDGSLDSNGIDEFLKIMSDIDKGTNVFVISHKTEAMIDKFDKIIKFDKSRNFSSIVQ